MVICMATDTDIEGESDVDRTESTQYETTVSGTWWYAVAAGTALWLIVTVMSLALPQAAVGTGVLGLVGWVALPGGIYFDSKYVRAYSQWDPRLIGWLIGAIIPLLNLFVGAAYLYRRHEVLGEP